jgi:hypothetical protein
VTAERHTEWVCEDCAVRCYKMGGEAFPRPEGWIGNKCVRCARDDEDPHDKARRMLKEGTAPSRVCVKGVSKKWMRETQQGLVEAGELDAAKVKKPAVTEVSPEKKQLAEAVLREDPELSDTEVGKRVGVSNGPVARARKRMGLPHFKVLRRETAKALVEAEPDLPGTKVVARLNNRVSRRTVREIREELNATPPA